MRRSWASAAYLFFRLPFSEQVHSGPVHELQTPHLHLQPLAGISQVGTGPSGGWHRSHRYKLICISTRIAFRETATFAYKEASACNCLDPDRACAG